MDEFISPDTKKQITNEFGILHLIYHRNRNQHRALIWWKYVNIIHRNIRKILKIIIDLESTKDDKKIQQKQQKVLEIIENLIKKRIFTKAYYEFNGIVALGQFVTLGLALIGNLSKLYCILQNFKGIDKVLEQKITDVKFTESVEYNEDDLGEVVEYENVPDSQLKRKVEIVDSKASKKTKKSADSIDDIFSTNITTQKPKKKSKSGKSLDEVKTKKKKKKRNEIDDIFNF